MRPCSPRSAALRLAWGFGLAATLFAGAAAAEERRVELAFQAPEDSHIARNLRGFAEQVEASETIEIDIVLHPGGDLYADDQMRQAVASGEIDMGVVALNRFADDIPAVSFFYLPFQFKTLEEHQRVTNREHPVRLAIDATIEETGVHALWWQSYGQIVLLSAGAPAKTPLSIDGNKVRVFSAEGGDLVAAAQGASAPMPGPELAHAFEDRGVDFALTDVATIARLELWRWARSLTLGTFGSIEMVVIANPAFWQSLSDDERTLLQEAAKSAEAAAREEMRALEDEVFAQAKENGVTLYKLGQEELATWADVKQALTDAYLDRAGGTGEWLLDALEGEVETPDN